MLSIGFQSFTSTTIPSSQSAAATSTVTRFFPSTGPKPIQSVKNPFQRWSRINRKYRSRGAQMSSAELKPSETLMWTGESLSDALKRIGKSIFIVGMNCSMKTKLGKILAKALGYNFFDSDDVVIQALESKLDAETLRKIEETDFCDCETDQLKEFSSISGVVLCAGDRAVQSETNLSYLRCGILIWIDVPLDMLAESASEIVSHIEVQDELSKRYENLKEGFATADARISVQGLACELGYDDLSRITAEDLAMEVLKRIEELPRVQNMWKEAGVFRGKKMEEAGVRRVY